MTRRFTDDIKTDINTDLADNIVGAITPALVRNILTDIIDSTTDDECSIYATALVTGIPLTATFQTLQVYDGTVGGDGDFLIPNQAAGSIQSKNVAGFTYTASAQFTFTCTDNIPVEFIIALNGVQQGIASYETGSGALDPVTVDIVSGNLSTPADAVWTVQVRAPEGPLNINIVTGYFALVIKPTDNPL